MTSADYVGDLLQDAVEQLDEVLEDLAEDKAPSLGSLLRLLLKARDEVYDLDLEVRDLREKLDQHDHFVVICSEADLKPHAYGPFGSWSEANDAVLTATTESVRCWGRHYVVELDRD